VDRHVVLGADVLAAAEEVGRARLAVGVEGAPQRAPAAPPTPVQAPVVQALKKAVKAVYGGEARPMGIGGGTVAAVFRRAGFSAACWSKLDETAHQPNEYCIIDNMVGDAKVYGHIFLQE
jgi:succinyl-diaminopimelate desuccinylase